MKSKSGNIKIDTDQEILCMEFITEKQLQKSMFADKNRLANSVQIKIQPLILDPWHGKNMKER